MLVISRRLCDERRRKFNIFVIRSIKNESVRLIVTAIKKERYKFLELFTSLLEN